MMDSTVFKDALRRTFIANPVPYPRVELVGMESIQSKDELS